MADLTNLVYTPLGHTDPRRKIVDVTNRIKVFYITDMENLRLGDHYHKKTLESFYVIDGKIHFKLEDINTKERKEYELKTGGSIDMPLLVAHLLLPSGQTRFLKILGNDFEETDLNFYKINW